MNAWPNRSRSARTLDGVEYAPGRKFRVVAEGVYATGMTPYAPSAWSGFRQALPVGTVIECAGFGAGWGSDPGFGVEWVMDGHVHVEVRPASPEGSMWAYRPLPGMLEPVEEEVQP